MRIDLEPIWSGSRTIGDLAAEFTLPDLRRIADELYAEHLALLHGATDADVVFVYDDPTAEDPGAEGTEANDPWTLGHVVVHLTAGTEEGAAAALTLARGAPLEGRPRYEVPWEGVTTIAQATHRLEESRRMTEAMLAAWPDAPHLDNTVVLIPQLGPMNAVGRCLLGLAHQEGHTPQLAEIVRQARAARGA